MRLLSAGIVALGLFAVLRFPLLQVAKSAWKKHDLEEKRKKGWWIAVVEEASNISLLAGVTFLLLSVFLLYIRWQGGTSVHQMSVVLTRLDRLGDSLKSLKAAWRAWLLFFSLVAFLYLWFRSGRQHFSEKFVRLVQERRLELCRVRKERPEEWEQLEPTPAMRIMEVRLRELVGAIRSLESTEPDKPAEGIPSKLGDLKSSSQQLSEQLELLDIERRIQIPWDMPVPEPHSWWAHVLNAIFSKGFLSDMKTLAKVFKYATLAAVFASLVTIQSASLTDAVTTRMAEIDDLRVAKSLQESRAQRQKAEERARKEDESRPTSQITPPPTLTPEQSVALRAFAHDAVKLFAHNPNWANSPQRDGASEDLRQVTVRLAVLEQVHDFERSGGARQAEDASEDRQFRAYAMQEARPQTLNPAGQSTFEELIKLPRSKRQTFLDKVVYWYEHKRADYSEPASAAEIQASFVESLIGSLIPEAPPESGEIGNQFREMMTEGLKTSGKNAFEIFRNVLVLQVLNDASPEEILTSVRIPDANFAYMTGAASRDFKSRLSIFSGSTRNDKELVQSAERQIARVNGQPEDNSAAVEALRNMPELVRKGRETELANLLSGFDSEFPNRGAPVAEFAREKILTAWGVQNANDANVRINRSTDFDKSQSYSRVGGILFGRKPNGNAQEMPNFWWESKENSISLYLRARDIGAPFAVGTFKPYLIWQSLAYAADQRTAVVTLLNAPDIDRRQVMIHPAFHDRALGCRLIAADQWIFHYTDPDPENPNSSEVRRMINRYEVESELYRAAWDALQNPMEEPKIKNSKQIIQFLRPKEKSPLEEAPQVQPELLRLAILCAVSRSTAFENCVRSGGESAAWRTQLPTQKPRFGFVSQIREGQYSIDNSLDFLRASEPSVSGVQPLELTVQMTINDTDHWQLPAFDSMGIPIVLKGLIRDRKAREVTEIQQLARLQRLFRVALNGGFGRTFPVEKLVELSAVAKSMDKEGNVETPRWLKERQNQDSTEHIFAKEIRNYLAGSRTKTEQPLDSKTAKVVEPLLTSCAKTLSAIDVESVSADILASECRWVPMRTMVEPDCKRAVATGKAYESVSACRLRSLAIYGEKVLGPIHTLRLSLHAATATSADTLSCPPVPANSQEARIR